MSREHLDFDCVNPSCPRRGFCKRADWRRGLPKRAWSSHFGEDTRRECQWFVPTEHIGLADVHGSEERKILRCLNDLYRNRENGNA